MSQLVLTADTLSSTTAGAFEYDGRVLYTTPQGSQRGVIPGAQFFRLNADLAGTQALTAQNMFGVGVTLSSNTVYAFDYYVDLAKTAGTTSHNVNIGFGGTATINNIAYGGVGRPGVGAYTTGNQGAANSYDFNTAASTLFYGPATSVNIQIIFYFKGTVSINTGGTFIPQYTLSAAPGGAYSTVAGSYFAIYPIGVGGANTSVGTWA